MNIQTIGIDIAKNVFQLHGVNRSGHVVLKRRVMRERDGRSYAQSHFPTLLTLCDATQTVRRLEGRIRERAQCRN